MVLICIIHILKMLKMSDRLWHFMLVEAFIKSFKFDNLFIFLGSSYYILLLLIVYATFKSCRYKLQGC